MRGVRRLSVHVCRLIICTAGCWKSGSPHKGTDGRQTAIGIWNPICHATRINLMSKYTSARLRLLSFFINEQDTIIDTSSRFRLDQVAEGKRSAAFGRFDGMATLTSQLLTEGHGEQRPARPPSPPEGTVLSINALRSRIFPSSTIVHHTTNSACCCYLGWGLTGGDLTLLRLILFDRSSPT